MAAFIRWNEITQIWEKAVDPNSPSTAWNHLPIANPTSPLDTVNKQYVDSAVAGVSGFVPYTGATANVNLGAYSLIATNINVTGKLSVTAGITLGRFATPSIGGLSVINDLNFAGLSEAFYINLPITVNCELTGIAAQEDGRIIVILNNSGASLIIKSNDARSALNNRFIALSGNADVTLAILQTAMFRYQNGWWQIGRT